MNILDLRTIITTLPVFHFIQRAITNLRVIICILDIIRVIYESLGLTEDNLDKKEYAEAFHLNFLKDLGVLLIIIILPEHSVKIHFF